MQAGVQNDDLAMEFAEKNIKMRSFKSRKNIQEKEGGPDRPFPIK